MKKSWRKLAPWLRWTILLVGGFFLLLFVVVLVEHIRGARQLAAWKAAMIAKGEKLTVEELRPKPPLPEDNGVWLLLGAVASLEQQTASLQVLEVEPRGEFISPRLRTRCLTLDKWAPFGPTNDWNSLSQVMTGAATNVEQLRVAVARPALDFGVTYAGFDQPIMHMTKLKSAASWLALAAVYEAHRGNLDAAVVNQEASVAMMVKFREEKLIISQLISISSGSIALTRTWEILQADGWTDGQLARLQAAWSKSGSVEAMLDSMAMERNMNLREFERIRAGDSMVLRNMYDSWRNPWFGGAAAPTDAWNVLLSKLDPAVEAFTINFKLPLWRLAYADQAACHLAGTWQGCIEHGRSVLAGIAGPDQEEEPYYFPQTKGPATNATAYDRIRFWPTETLGAVVNTWARGPMRFEAERELTVTAIALKRYHLKQGCYPESLDALVPVYLQKVPLDIYSRQPLHYHRESDGTFLLYSVGRDGKDDLGQHGNDLGGTRLSESDLIWPHAATPEQIAEWEKKEKR